SGKAETTPSSERGWTWVGFRAEAAIESDIERRQNRLLMLARFAAARPLPGHSGRLGLNTLWSERVESCHYAAIFVRHAGEPQAHFHSAERSREHDVVEAAEMSDAKR